MTLPTIEKIEKAKGLFKIGDEVRLLVGNVTYVLKSVINIRGIDHDIFVIKNERHNIGRWNYYKKQYNLPDYWVIKWYDSPDIFCPIERLPFEVSYWTYKGQKYCNKLVADHMYSIYGGEAPIEIRTDRVDKLIVSA